MLISIGFAFWRHRLVNLVSLVLGYGEGTSSHEHSADVGDIDKELRLEVCEQEHGLLNDNSFLCVSRKWRNCCVIIVTVTS